MVKEGLLVALGALVAMGCKPNLDQTVSLISSTRVLAVAAQPAEASPTTMTPVSFSLLVVDENGVVTRPDAEWTFCQTRNPLANLGPVDPSCVQPWSQPPPIVEDDASLCPGIDAAPCLVPVPPPYVAFGGGEAATGIVPIDACSLFGPNPPPPVMNQPPGRPVDPDPTGGYYQPVTAFVVSQSTTIPTMFPYRISCGFANVDPTSSGELTSRYHLNVNPTIASLTIGGAMLQPDSTGMTNAITAGQKLNLEVAWPMCPVVDVCGDNVCGADESSTSCPADCMTPKGCAGAERFVNYDLTSYSVVDQREGMHVSWYVTGGAFDNDRTGRDGTDTTLTSDNGWQAPEAPGPLHMWIVLADDRGGVGWAGYSLNVQ